jgi:hypothetical protein
MALNSMKARSAMRRSSKRTRRRGAVIVEYAFLLTAIAIPAMAGIVIGGAAMLKNYQEARGLLLRTFP